MNSIVVDSSVVIKWFVTEIHSGDARRLLNDYQSGSVEFLAPDLLAVEFGNIVWKKQRFQGLDVNDAQQIIDVFRTLAFLFTPSAELLDEAYRLAVQHQRTVYDMTYLALATRKNVSMVTADQRMMNSVGGAFANLVWVGNWP